MEGCVSVYFSWLFPSIFNFSMTLRATHGELFCFRRLMLFSASTIWKLKRWTVGLATSSVSLVPTKTMHTHFLSPSWLPGQCQLGCCLAALWKIKVRPAQHGVNSQVPGAEGPRRTQKEPEGPCKDPVRTQKDPVRFSKQRQAAFVALSFSACVWDHVHFQ